MADFCINLWKIPKELLAYIDCEKNTVSINGLRVESIFYFRNHIRAYVTGQGEYRFYEMVHPDTELRIS